MIQKHKIAIAVYGQQARGTIDGVTPVCDPNNSLNRDVLVPDSDIAIVGIVGSEETKLKASSFRNQLRRLWKIGVDEYCRPKLVVREKERQQQ